MRYLLSFFHPESLTSVYLEHISIWTNHILSAQKPHVAGGYQIVQAYTLNTFHMLFMHRFGFL